MFCFVVFCFISKTQNLVPNSSFENNINCVSFNINNALPWCPVGKNNVLYFYECQNDPSGTTPFQYIDNCFQSYQMPRTGKGYAIIGVYNSASSSNYDCIAQVKLNDTLKSNSVYCITYYVSLFNYCKYSVDKLGARLSSIPHPCIFAGTNTVSIAGSYTPQIISPAGVQLDDTLNWMEVSGIYTATGNELYITIGDFFLQSQHSIVNSYSINCNGVAEYYVDDVSVEEIEIAKAKNDTLIYATDSVIIGKNASEAALFSWQPTTGLSCTNCPNPKASPSVNTTYTVTKTQCKSVTTDEITVTVSPVGLAEAELVEAAIKLVPNPTSEVLNVTSRFDFEKIELLSITGQVLLSETVNDKTHELQLQNFAEGIYFVRVVYPNGLINTKKLMVQH